MSNSEDAYVWVVVGFVAVVGGVLVTPKRKCHVGLLRVGGGSAVARKVCQSQTRILLGLRFIGLA